MCVCLLQFTLIYICLQLFKSMSVQHTIIHIIQANSELKESWLKFVVTFKFHCDIQLFPRDWISFSLQEKNSLAPRWSYLIVLLQLHDFWLCTVRAPVQSASHSGRQIDLCWFLLLNTGKCDMAIQVKLLKANEKNCMSLTKLIWHFIRLIGELHPQRKCY